MKKFYFLLALLVVVAAFNLQAQQTIKHKVYINSFNGMIAPYTGVEVNKFYGPNTITPREQSYIQALTDFNTKKKTHDQIQEEFGPAQPFALASWQDTSDNNVVWINEQAKDTLEVAIFKFPQFFDNIWDANPVPDTNGWAKTPIQFFYGYNARLTIDSALLGIFRPNNWPAFDKELMIFMFRTPINLNTYLTDSNFVQFNMEDIVDNYIIGNVDYLDNDEINNTHRGNLRFFYRYGFPEDIVINPNESFGLALYSQDDFSTENYAYIYYGHYEFNLPVSQCLGGLVRSGQSPTIGEYEYAESITRWRWNLRADRRNNFPGIHGNPIKENFEVILLGMAEEVTSVEEIGGAAALDIYNYPNPANEQTKIVYSIPTDGNVKVTIFDATGKEYGTMVNGFAKAGTYETALSTNLMPAGSYYYTISFDGQVVTKSLKVVR